jgi:hypothetical protein
MSFEDVELIGTIYAFTSLIVKVLYFPKDAGNEAL